MSFAIYECYVAEDGSIQRKLVANSNTAEQCFTVLHERGHQVQGVKVHNGFHQTEVISAKRTKKECDLVYFEYSGARKIAAEPGSRFYLVENSKNDQATYLSFCQQHQQFCANNTEQWSSRARWRKALHPRNSLILAFLCVAAGLILTAFFPPIGLVAAPFLVFFAVGFATVSAITAIVYAIDVYAIDWLKPEYLAYQREATANRRQALGLYSWDFIKHCFREFKDWAKVHKFQTALMVIGAILLLGALIVTAGYFIAPAVFGFMALGAAGGAIGLTTSFFSTGFGVAAAGGLLSTLASAFAGVVLILGLPHVLDTIRAFFSGLFKDKSNQNTYFIADGEAPNHAISAPSPRPIDTTTFKPSDEEVAAFRNKVLTPLPVDSETQKLRNEINNNLGSEIDCGDTGLDDFLGEYEELDVEKNSDSNNASNTSSDDEGDDKKVKDFGYISN